MVAFLVSVCAVLLVAVFVRMGRVASAIEALLKAQHRPAESHDVAGHENKTAPMSETNGPRTLAEMRRYFSHAATARKWDVPDPAVVERFEKAVVRGSKTS
jgi:hypothetical protein